ncbi:MAG: hypothetical protein JWR16_1139 [Nevskia sp.]|nr:hypothetical protein [Nevskia sp.]
MKSKAQPRVLRRKYLIAAIGSAFIAPLAQAASPGSPLGPTVDLNSSLAGNQTTPAIARNASGAIVVAWQGVSGNSTEIIAQRLGASGIPQGSAFIANQNVAGDPAAPAVAMDADGDFVLAWADGGAAHPGIYARRFAANGTARGDELLVAAGSSSLSAPSVAMDADGDFVVAWTQGRDAFVGVCSGYSSLCVDISGSSVRAQRYHADGTAAGRVLTVDTALGVATASFAIGSVDYEPSVVMGTDGSFVVTWLRYGDGLLSGIWDRRYSARDLPGLPYPVDLGHWKDSIAAAGSGNGETVVAYNASSGFYAHSYSASGIAEGAAQRADENSKGAGRPAVGMDAAGDFVVIWDDLSGAVGQRFARGGGKLGGNFALSTYCCVRNPAVAADARGNFAAAWEEAGHIKLRLYMGP